MTAVYTKRDWVGMSRECLVDYVSRNKRSTSSAEGATRKDLSARQRLCNQRVRTMGREPVLADFGGFSVTEDDFFQIMGTPGAMT